MEPDPDCPAVVAYDNPDPVRVSVRSCQGSPREAREEEGLKEVV